MGLTRASTSLRIIAILWLATLAASARPAFGQAKPPQLTQPVNDFAKVIDPASSSTLDERIRALHKTSGDVVVVATIKTFRPWGDIRSYATAMFENHGRGIGAKGKDNGLLILLAVEDRQVWVEVGYDLEGIVTDGFSGETSRQVMAPRFREGQYGRGLVDGASRIIGRIADARKVAIDGVTPAPADERLERGMRIGLLALVVIAILIATTVRGRGGREPHRRWRGGVGRWGGPYYGGHWGGGTTWRGSSGGFGGFGGGRSGGGGGGASW